MEKIIGKVHSYESFGTVDGPGVRYVIFTQGCPLRCKYCHNPDTRLVEKTRYFVEPKTILEEIKKGRNFYKKGGVTITGGEPLQQPEFVKEMFRLCKEEGLHTAVDTSGFYLNDMVKKALEYADLALLDIKCIDPHSYLELTQQELEPTLNFARYLAKNNKTRAWIRYVLVPEITDKDELIQKLALFIVSEIKNIVDRVEVLPYHTMGVYKYEKLGFPYPIPNIKPPSPERVENAKHIFKSHGLTVW